jgi:hypothetical protein
MQCGLSLGPASPRLRFLFLLFDVLMASFLTRVHILLIEVFQHIVVIILGALIDLPGEEAGQTGELFCGEVASFGHVDFEFDDEVAAAHGVLEEGHAEASNYLLLFIAQDLSLASVHIEDTAIEVLHFELETDQSFD